MRRIIDVDGNLICEGFVRNFTEEEKAVLINAVRYSTPYNPTNALTEAEKIICRMYLEDLDKFHTCNEYKILMNLIDDAATAHVPEDSVNCVLTMFGNCSYNETGCSDCAIKDKIRKALNNKPHGTWMFDEKGYFYCDQCGKYPHDQYATTDFCPHCGADLR